MIIEPITTDTNTFDNLKDRPEKPTSEEIGEIIYPKPQGVVADTAYTIYSPNERVIGEWQEMVDGVLKKKPVYQKTTLYTLDDSTTDQSVNANLGSVDRLIETSGMCSHSNGLTIRPIEFTHFAVNNSASTLAYSLSYGYFKEGDRWEFYRGMNFTIFKYVNITAQYTKTTDPWEVV